MDIRSSRGFWGRLRRIPSAGWVGGVCAGFAEYFDWNVRLIRALTVAATIFVLGPAAFIAYAVLWYVMEPARPGEAFSGRSASPARGGSFIEGPRSSLNVKERFSRLERRLAALEECVTSEEFELRREFKKLGA